MTSSLTTFDYATRRYYNPGKVDSLVCKDRPYLGKLKKTGNATGNLWCTPITVYNPQGTSGLLSSAQTIATAVNGGGNIQGKQWQSTWGQYHGNTQISAFVIALTKDNMGAFIENQRAEIDGIYNNFADTMAYYSLANAGRSVTPGQFTAVTGGINTLSSPDDAVYLAVGQQLQISVNDGSTSTDIIVAGSGVGFVVAVNANAGTFTVSATDGGAAGLPANWTNATLYYAFKLGDFLGNVGTRIMLGLGSWVPAVDPASTLFEGVDRTFNVMGLSGVRLTSTEIAGLGTEDRVKKLVTRMTGRGMGPGPTDVFCNPEKWQAIANSMESKGQRPLDGKIGTFNYQKLQVAAGGKMVDVWADRFCPLSRLYAVNFDYIELKHTADGFPGVLNGDGLQMLRKSGSNDFEFRIWAIMANQVRAPGYQGTTSV